MCCNIVVTEKSNLGSPFFGAFLFDSIHQATKYVNVQFFIHSCTISDELLIDSSFALQKSSNLTFPFLLSTRNFCFEMTMMISIQNIVVLCVDLRRKAMFYLLDYVV